MDEVRNLTDLVTTSANEFWTAVGGFVPKLIGAIVVIVLGALLAKLVERLVVRGLEFIGVNKLKNNKTVSRTLETTGLKGDFVAITGRVAFWVVIIIFAITAAEVLELTAMRDVIGDLLAYLPSVFAAVIVLTVTIAGARLLRDAVAAALSKMSVDYVNPVANVAFYVLVIFGSLMALNQLGFDTTILTANVTVIVAGVMLAFALAFGLGGKDVAARILEKMYDNTKHFKGDR
ncbi:MAG: hypothetical protein WD061_00925 [Candidatus Saccharimonadales bacterium]